jgi:putative ABC transport system permease protein
VTPGALLRFYRVRLRSRLGAELLAAVGIAVGVALVFAALIAGTSLTGGVRELSEGIVGEADFQLSARSAAGFDQRIFKRVRAIAGTDAVAVAEARVNLVGPEGRRSVLLVGGDPRLRGRPGLSLPPLLRDELGLEVGSRVAVETGAGTVRPRVAGNLGEGKFGALVESPVALTSLPLAQGLIGMRGRISRIFVGAAPEREGAVESSLREIAGNRLNLAPADQEVVVFEHAAYPTTASTTLFSGLSALVGFLFALNAMLLIAPQRRRLIAELRMAGYAPVTVVVVFLLDALVLGVVGVAAGLLLGEACSWLLFDSAPDFLSSAFAIGSQRIVTWQSAAVAAGAGLLAACLSVLAPIRDSLSSAPRPLASPRGPKTRGGALLGGGLAVLACSLVMVALAPALSLIAIVVLLLALLLLLQPWLRLGAAALDAVCRRLRSPVVILAALELRAGSARGRALVLAATGAVAAFASISIGGAGADLQRGLDRVAVDQSGGAEVWVAFRGPTNIFGTTAVALPPEQRRAIVALPGVRAVGLNRGAFLDVGHDRVWVQAPARSRVARVVKRQIVEGEEGEAARRLRQGRWLTLSEGLASELGVGVGDRVELPLPVPMRLRVAALTDNFGWPGGAVVTSGLNFVRGWGSGAPGALGVSVEPGARPARVAAAVRRTLGPESQLRVETARERTRRQEATARAGLSRLSQIKALVLFSSALAMAASMAGLIWQRRPVFAALKLHGLGEGELWRALLLEGAMLLGVGCLAGAAFGLIGQVLLDQGLKTITGFPVVYETVWATAAQVLVLLTGAAVAVLAVPGWVAVRVRPSAGLAT